MLPLRDEDSRPRAPKGASFDSPGHRPGERQLPFRRFLLWPRPDAFLAHPRLEDLWNLDGAVGLLVVLQDGQDGPGDGDRGAVERVDEARPLLTWRPVADVEPAGLVVGA